MKTRQKWKNINLLLALFRSPQFSFLLESIYFIFNISFKYTRKIWVRNYRFQSKRQMKRTAVNQNGIGVLAGLSIKIRGCWLMPRQHWRAGKYPVFWLIWRVWFFMYFYVFSCDICHSYNSLCCTWIYSETKNI